MSNHGHLVFLAGNDPPSKLMRPLESGFAIWWNRQMRKRGYPYNGSLSREYALQQRQRIRANLKLPAELSTGYSGEQSAQFGIAPRSLAAQAVRYIGSPELALQKVAAYLGIVPYQMQSRNRYKAISHGRAALVQTWAAIGRPITEIAPIIGISHQAAYRMTQKSIDRHLIQQLIETLLL